MCNCKKSVQKTSGVKAVSKPSTAAATPVKSVRKTVAAKKPSSVKRVVVRRPL